jgi:membrane protein
MKRRRQRTSSADDHSPSREHSSSDRGREAESPAQIPAKGWRDIGLRVKREASEDNVSIVAAGVAYYAFLAIFPALAAVILIYGLFADPAAIEHNIASLSAIPSDVRDMLSQQLTNLARRSSGALSAGLAVSILFALWSATKGMKALMTSLNIAYGEREQRGFFHRTALTLLFTAGAIAFAAVAVVLVAVFPAAVDRIGLPDVVATVIRWARWPILAAAVLLGLALLYRYGPSRRHARWRWVTWGSGIGTAVWLAASAGFSFYASHFGSYNKTYGSVAAIVILLTWFLLSAYIVIFGAELNGEMEHQTVKDTTTGPPKPLGRRGAHYADTVGDTP